MRKEILFLLLIMFASMAFAAGNGKDWLNSPDIEDMYSENYPEIYPTDIYQVVPTKESTAIHRLEDTNFQKITEDMAEWYTGHYYQCEKGKQPYLVRAVYGHGGTGEYRLKRIGEALLIMHGSLGKRNVYNKSALIVNSDFEPKELFIVVSIDR
jgi:hypothetical protein